jgi:hypothetical protein
MSRPPLEVADLIHAAGPTFYQGSRKWFTWLHLKILTAIVWCRTSKLGGHWTSAPLRTSRHLFQLLPYGECFVLGSAAHEATIFKA